MQTGPLHGEKAGVSSDIPDAGQSAVAENKAEFENVQAYSPPSQEELVYGSDGDCQGMPCPLDPASPAASAPYVQAMPAAASIMGHATEAPAGKGSKARTFALICAGILCIFCILGIVSCTSMMGVVTASSGIAASQGEVDSSKPKVAVITMSGTIQYDGSACSPSGLNGLLKQASSRDDIKAVVLRIDSGGGVATAGEEMSKYVADFTKPVVVSCAATAASAAYEIASQAEYIYAPKTSQVGSIGVAFQVTDLSGLYDKLGIDVDNITSAKSKDSTYGNRPLTKEERAWYQKMVDKIDADFIATVAKGRNMPEDKVKKLANGLTYTGTEAAENGLVDDVGYLEDAVSKASKLAGFDSVLEQTNLSISKTVKIENLIDVLGNANGKESLDSLIGGISNSGEAK